MKRISLLALLLIGCGSPQPEPPGHNIQETGRSRYVWHDEERGVTCWILSVHNGAGISCLPDSSFAKK